MANEEFDVIVVGGGPSGSSCSAFLSKAGRKVLLLDRAKFPRDKTCGDGISGRSVSVLKELGIIDQFSKVERQVMNGVIFSSPKGDIVPISSDKPDKPKEDYPGFICRREVFDNVIFQNAKKLAAKTIEGFMVTDVIKDGDKITGVKGTLDGKEYSYNAKIVVGADGAGGIISRKVGTTNTDDKHLCAAVRCYYEGVEGMDTKIELHFVKSALPGYFWIFPLPNKKANVGIGMVVKDMKAKKVNLQKVMFDIIENNPDFKERFKNAKKISEVKSWMLPFASKVVPKKGKNPTPDPLRMRIYGNGYLVVGDAASLVDPFTGEGIGNGLTSGRAAAKVINDAFAKKDFTAQTLSAYDKNLFDEIGDEVRTNYDLQKMGNNEFLLNLIVGRAKKSKYVQGVISDALVNPEEHKTLMGPMFILKALFAP